MVYFRLMLPLFIFQIIASTASAKTLILNGNLASQIRITHRITFGVNEPKNSLVYRFALPYQGSTRSVNQQITGLTTDFSPQPASVKDETDRYGNHFRIVTWKKLEKDASLILSYEAALKSELKAMESRTPFPLQSIPADEQIYLQASEQVQSGNPAIKAKARELVAGAASEYEAVTAIMRFVANHIAYGYNPPRYDALYSLETRDGNCQNYAHLALALLRASGIPGRAVGGYSLKEQWKIPVGKGSSLVQGMGQGGHAWLEIYFPDLGWLSYDPQQSMQFTSTRHVKQTHGQQVKGIVDTWTASAPMPKYSESIDSTFLDDQVNLSLTGEASEPRGYLVSNKVTSVRPELPPAVKPEPPTVHSEPPPAVVKPAPAPQVVLPPPPIAVKPAPAPPPAVLPKPSPPPPVVVKPDPAPPVILPPPPIAVKPAPAPPPAVLPKPLPPPPAAAKPAPAPLPAPARMPPPAVKPAAPSGKENEILLGNMKFPTLVDVYQTAGDTGTRILDKETAEYVTSKNIYAQAFMVDKPLRIKTVSLAMKKFGGDGTLYLDVVADDGGKPGLVRGVRSLPVYLEQVKRLPGYGWLDFSIPSDAEICKPGRYWIVLRRSGDAVLNWFYTPGKRYGNLEDTRSTALGWQWEDILNYEFVFKVAGQTVAP